MSTEETEFFRAAIRRAEAARGSLQRDFEQQVERLDTELAGLRLALDRISKEADVGREGGGTTQLGGPSVALSTEATPMRSAASTTLQIDRDVAEWRALPRTEAVLRALHASGGELHRREISNYLKEKGREADSMNDISAALAYMARGKRARVASVGRGVWRLAEPAERSAAS